MQITKEEVTDLLVRWSDGDPRALEILMPLVVDELRLLARGFFKGERNEHTLQPTALVNEVYLKLAGQRQVRWQNRAQFFKFASTLMRRVLVDYARTKRTVKRGRDAASVPLDEVFVASETADPDVVLAIDECLVRLGELNPRQAQIVEMRYFIGLTMGETAEVLGVAIATVKREWSSARLWLLHELRALEQEDADRKPVE